MLKLYFALKILAVVAYSSGDLTTSLEGLPSWIKDNPGFKNPIEVDSIKNGSGSIRMKEKGSKGWKIFLNEKAGYGIEIELEILKSNPDVDEFLLVSPWPISEDFKQMQLFTGTFTRSKKLRIPNTKTFYILFSTSQNSLSPEMALKYRRYGASLEVRPPPNDIPVKKETIYEVQLKGKSPIEFSTPEFLTKVKEGLRASARRYCTIHKIPFNETLTTKEMVVIRRISFCPFEWPERNVCASVEHSIFVSGVRTPVEEFILNYQLTADHLRYMWSEDNFQELQELGITARILGWAGGLRKARYRPILILFVPKAVPEVNFLLQSHSNQLSSFKKLLDLDVFNLPATSYTVLYWSLIIGLMIICSLLGTFVFWKANDMVDNSSRKNSTASYEIKKTKKPKLKLAKHQQVPSFMYKSPKDNQMESVMRIASEEVRLKQKAEVGLKPEEPSGLPNYFGSILFGINRGFEDEEESSIGLQTKLPQK